MCSVHCHSREEMLVKFSCCLKCIQFLNKKNYQSLVDELLIIVQLHQPALVLGGKQWKRRRSHAGKRGETLI